MNTTPQRIRNSRNTLHRFVTTLAALAALGVGLAPAPTRADTTISGTVTVTDPATYFGSAGIVTIPSGTTLQIFPGSNGTYTVSNGFVLNGGAGTVNLKCNRNDTIFNFTGPFSSTASAAQTLAITTGYAGNGDREEITFSNGLPNASGGSPLSIGVTFAAQTKSIDFVNLSGANTFTGNITLTQGNAAPDGYLTVGGRGYYSGGYAVTAGTGSLAPNFPGTVALGTATNFVYASSTAQNMAGVISGVGAVRVAAGALTLSVINTYTGNSTVNSGGSLVLSSTGGLKFVVTDSTANKVTGTGSATLNGTFTLDTSAVTVTSGSWPLVDATTKTFGASFALNGFTGPVGNLYTRSGAGKTWTFDKSTGVLSLASSAIITSFGIPGSVGVINQTTKTIALTVPYTPWGLNGLATLAPTFTPTSGTCNQTSGSPPSPTFASANPATYTVTDGATVNNYTVTVTVTPASAACAMMTCNFGALGQAAINESAAAAVLTVPPNQPVTSLAPTFTLSTNATINPSSGTTRNFTSPVVYRVTAENGTTFKDYTVSVETYDTWTRSGSLFINTTSAGANIAAAVTASNFPLLVRFNSSNFNFADAQGDGRDIRFTTVAGAAIPFQIEQWDAVTGSAAVWLRMPTITGNSTQEIKMYWGKSGVSSLSNGSSVFNSTNGYASVVHLGDTLADEVGTTTPTNVSSTASNGLIGRGRTFASGNGVSCGTGITGLPTGAGPFSTGVWIRTATSGTTVLGWGIQQGSGKVVMQLASPPTISMDCFFGGASISGSAPVPTSQWTYIVHTFQSTGTKLYVNGVLDVSNGGGTMNIPTPSNFSIGGWGPYSYVGDMDEVRISNVVRPADWVKLEYENQKPLQTLVGGIVPSGSGFSVSPSSVTVNETASATLTAQAGGAQKVYWILKKNGVETVLATDQLTFTYTAPRVSSDDSAVIVFKAVFPAGTQTIDVPLAVLNTVPDPAFTLVPSTTQWDGRQTMTVSANITNLAAMQAAGFGTLNYKWSVSGVAVTKQANNGTLTLTRSQGSGPMIVTLILDNGGAPISRSTSITVQEPATDAWAQRTPGANEKPVNMQFFARDPGTGLGTVYYNGTQTGSPDTVYLKVYKTPSGGSESLDATYRQPLVGGAYAFSAPIAAGLTTYRVVYGTTTSTVNGGADVDVTTVTDLLCGDAFIIEGQSNALATDNAVLAAPAPSPWIRTYGKTLGWGNAVNKSSRDELQLGVWGMFQAQRLLANNNMPICIINGARGGTRIDQHMPNATNHALAKGADTIYADLYNRLVGAKLTHGIRALLWHQGEQDQSSEGPDGDYDYKFYQQYFVDLSASWKQDFPNIRNYYIFQIYPGACGYVSRNDQLREVQRNLPKLYSNMKIMSTLSIASGANCHYDEAGYQVFSNLMGPLIEQDAYGQFPTAVYTAPNLKKAYFTNTTKNEVALEFDQDMAWNPGAPTVLFLTNSSGLTSGSVSSGIATGNTIKLQVSGASSATTITYVKGATTWAQANILRGTNGIAALTFADVALGLPAPVGLSATAGSGQVALTWTATTGATSYNVKRSTTSGGPYTTIATTSAPAYTDLSVVGGTPYFYVVSAVNTVGTSSSEGLDSTQATATPAGSYAAWAANAAQGLTAGVNDGPLDDPERDGLPNLLEFVLGGAPMVSSPSVLPKLSRPLTNWVFEYDRSTASVSTITQVVEYGSGLTGWTAIPVTAASGGPVSITPGGQTDHVAVTIPVSGGDLFVRLKVTK